MDKAKESLLKDKLAYVIGDLQHYVAYQKSLGVEFLPGSAKKIPHPQPTLTEVREELGECKRCKLHFTRRHIVFGEGSEKALLVFIGEAPGEDEDRQGRPFVGKAGQLLTRIINAIDLRREEVYITNIIKCRPPHNRNPQQDEIATCEPFLKKQLEIIQPKIICALGSFAAQTLLKTDEKISQLRGRFFLYRGIKVMPTYHPAFLLRNPHKKREVWKDIKKIHGEYIK
ncbi:MAG: uracil-DNA glycosylase [Syntrophobacterales bacterium]|nr:MAG: uracil-DNA glycosylase [Syntrophobacterales bacterium]